jgi:hypothetical protein
MTKPPIRNHASAKAVASVRLLRVRAFFHIGVRARIFLNEAPAEKPNGA